MTKIYIITIYYKICEKDARCKTHVKTLTDLKYLASLDSECSLLYSYYRFEINIL